MTATYGQQQPLEVLPGGPLHRRGVTGASFTTDFSTIGAERTQKNNLFTGQKTDVIDEERRLIEKVFSIVDKDNSGTIDMKELEEMFKVFSVDTSVLRTAITRIMSNVDKDHDNSISPAEFYKLLSQKFEPGDPKSEVENVFNRMDRKRDAQLDVDELYEVAQMLGETMTKPQIKEMIVNFKILHNDMVTKGPTMRRNSLVGAMAGQADFVATKGAAPKKAQEIKEMANPTLGLDEFYSVMQVEL